MDIKQVKEKNEALIKKYLIQNLDGSFDIEVDWGMPMTRLNLSQKFEKPEQKFEIVLNMNYLESTYEISMKSTNEKGELDWSTISSSTIKYFMDFISNISSQLFITNMQENEDEDVDGGEMESDGVNKDTLTNENEAGYDYESE